MVSRAKLEPCSPASFGGRRRVSARCIEQRISRAARKRASPATGLLLAFRLHLLLHNPDWLSVLDYRSPLDRLRLGNPRAQADGKSRGPASLDGAVFYPVVLAAQ